MKTVEQKMTPLSERQTCRRQQIKRQGEMNKGNSQEIFVIGWMAFIG